MSSLIDQMATDPNIKKFIKLTIEPPAHVDHRLNL